MIASDVAALVADEVEEARQGTEIRASHVVFWVPKERCEQAVVKTRAVLARLAAAGLAVDVDGVSVQPAVPESEWRDAWKRHFHTTRLTRQIVVVPSWESFAPGADDLVIHLDPGQAFGTGAHASTRLVLNELQWLSDRGMRVRRFLDMGTGSGILAIAAAKLWPQSTGLAVDIDPLAVSAASENSHNNGVANRIRCGSSGLADTDEVFDLVLANIQADVLNEMSAYLADRLGPRGQLILSGLLEHQVDAVASAVAARGALAVTAVRSGDDGWCSAVLSPATS